MLARYREVVSTVLFYTKSNEKLIRRAVIQMLPRLAAFAPERFARMHLQPCTVYLLSVLKNPSERGAGMHNLASVRVLVQPLHHTPSGADVLLACLIQDLGVVTVYLYVASHYFQTGTRSYLFPPLRGSDRRALAALLSQSNGMCMRAGFVALGDMATALAKSKSAAGMEDCLEAVAVQIKDTIAPASKGRSRSYSPEALNVRDPIPRIVE